MTVKTAFIVGDLLTLLASCQKYPEGFVGVGPRPRDMYCVEKVMDNQSDALKKLRTAYEWIPKSMRFFLMIPNRETAGALWWDEADPKCKACGRPVGAHPFTPQETGNE